MCKSCPPSNHILKYRYTLDEFPTMLQPLKQRTLEYEDWTNRANKIIKCEIDVINISDVQALFEESKNKLYPINTEIYESLKSLINEMKKENKSNSSKKQNDKKSPSNKKLKVEVSGKQCSNFSSSIHSPTSSLSSPSSYSSLSSFGYCKNEMIENRDESSKSKKMKKS